MTAQQPLSAYTTLRVGGPAREIVAPETERELVTAVTGLWEEGEDWLLLGGGSNLVVADAGFDGAVIRVVTRGIEELDERDGRVRLRVQAGEPWDGLVARSVERGWRGIEAMSGIPGSVGAAPIQNIGAYGQELASSLVAVDFVDRFSGERRRIPAEELELGYRSSALKRERRGLVVAVEIELAGGGRSEPVAYQQLAASLGVGIGDRVPLEDVREHVLALRAAKGMLLSPADPDSASAGSFFTNPIVRENFARGLPADAPRWPATIEEQPVVQPLDAAVSFDSRMVAGTPLVKLSAAWLIEHAGVHRGFRLPGSAAAISSKHTLAIVNTGGATAEQIAELARYIQARVQAEFGVILQPEPALVGIQL